MDDPNPLTRALAPGERLLWAGQPVRPLYDPFVWCERVMGAAFAAVGVYLCGLPGQGGMTQRMAGIILVFGISVFLLLGRPWMRERLRRNTWYAVTDRRLMWATGWWPTEGAAVALAPRLPVWTERRRPDGTGTLHFGDEPGPNGSPPSFESICDADAVRELVARQIADLGHPAPQPAPPITPRGGAREIGGV